jgi:hypothetical protein
LPDVLDGLLPTVHSKIVAGHQGENIYVVIVSLAINRSQRESIARVLILTYVAEDALA